MWDLESLIKILRESGKQTSVLTRIHQFTFALTFRFVNVLASLILSPFSFCLHFCSVPIFVLSQFLFCPHSFCLLPLASFFAQSIRVTFACDCAPFPLRQVRSMRLNGMPDTRFSPTPSYYLAGEMVPFCKRPFPEIHGPAESGRANLEPWAFLWRFLLAIKRVPNASGT